MVGHLETNKTGQNQHGFMQEHFFDRQTEPVDVVYLDFQMAFSTVRENVKTNLQYVKLVPRENIIQIYSM